MNALSLFTGIMGIDLACEWAGIETIAMCERDEFCQKVIRKHRPHIPLYDDVCTLTKERLEGDGIGTIDLIHGGFPCQPFSQAGQRRGSEDDRYLWPEIVRLLGEIKPRWFIGENVAGLLSMEQSENSTHLENETIVCEEAEMVMETIRRDLQNGGYTSVPIVIPSCAVGAFHRRERVFIVAHANSEHGSAIKNETRMGYKQNQAHPRGWDEFQFIVSGNNNITFQQNAESEICGNDDGVSRELDEFRLKALGNAVNPYQVYPILAAIKQIDDSLRGETAC